MPPDDAARLGHMIEAIEAAQRFVQGRSRSDLEGDEMLRFALVRAVEIVGEAAAQVSAERRSSIPDIPWPLVVGMRNRLIHGYFAVDTGILWTTVTEAMPSMLPALRTAVVDS